MVEKLVLGTVITFVGLMAFNILILLSILTYNTCKQLLGVG